VRSSQLSESYARNLKALRDALEQIRKETHETAELPDAQRVSWNNVLGRAIQWIENPDSDF